MSAERPGDGAPRVERGRIAVLSASWTGWAHEERVAAVRSVVAALSRSYDVDLLVAGSPGHVAGDGAFDPIRLGEPPRGARWPPPEVAGRQVPSGPHRAVVVDEGDEEAGALAATVLPGVPVVAVGAATDGEHSATGTPTARPVPLLSVDLGDPGGPDVHPVGLYARVHPDAKEHHHQAIGPIGPYLLVLGDRPGAVTYEEGPSDRVRWLLARFAGRHLVVVEAAGAIVWRSRSAVNVFRVHSRMDLWRLIARATATVDLCPGSLFARECVESLRYGVPVIAPAGSRFDAFVARGGGLSFTNTAELFACVEALDDEESRRRLGTAGGAIADEWYGKAEAFVARLAAALDKVIDRT